MRYVLDNWAVRLYPRTMSVSLDSFSITHGIQRAVAVFWKGVALFWLPLGRLLAENVMASRLLKFSGLQKKGSIR